jgi:fumarate reductase (CoM/CoB) subunit A
MREEKAEILILGSEAAGAKAAIEAQEEGADVLVVTKGLKGRSGSTIMAGTGVQSPIGQMDPRDNPDVFFKDVIRGGGYLNNQKLVEKLVNLAVTEIPKMEKWGAKFKKVKDNKFFQYQVPGSTYPRTLSPLFPAGQQWRRAFANQFDRLNTRILEDVFITDLLVTEGQVAGAIGISLRDGEVIVFRAKVTILATGGCGQIYRRTDTSRDATGDGIIAAYHAGAELADMEFQQFFPYSCYTPPFEMDTFPATFRYYLRGRFYNSLGEPFMDRYFPDKGEWALRTETSRAIYMENKLGRGGPHGGAYLSVTHLPRNLLNAYLSKERRVQSRFKKIGIDIFTDAIECGPACHYSIGGVRVNENCETNLPRLYAAGEVAAGMDGAERIDGGPAITWCITMGYVAAKEAVKAIKGLDWPDIDPAQVKKAEEKIAALQKNRNGIKGFEIKYKIKDIMYDNCAVVKNGKDMEEALSTIQKIKCEDLPRLCVPGSSKVFNMGLVEAFEAMNMTEIAEMVIKASLMRQESRGSHYRTDFLKLDNKNWAKNIIISEDKGKMTLTTAPPVVTRMPPIDEEEI